MANGISDMELKGLMYKAKLVLPYSNFLYFIQMKHSYAYIIRQKPGMNTVDPHDYLC